MHSYFPGRKSLLLTKATAIVKIVNIFLRIYYFVKPWNIRDWCKKYVSHCSFKESTVWKLRNFLLLRFYVKSIVSNLESEKLPSWQFQSLWILIFSNFQPWNHQNQKLQPQQMLLKMAVFVIITSWKLISRKIWMAE